MDSLGKLQNLIVQISDVEEVKGIISGMVESGVNPVHILDVLNKAMKEVGRRYEKGEYFLSELIMAGVLASEVTKMLRPQLVEAGVKSHGKIVIGTVKGDIHDIGKNIIVMMLGATGFEVVDLGVDVSAGRFADAVDKEDPDILGVSALLTSTMGNLRDVIEVLKDRGLRGKVKVVVGGRPLTQEFADEIGADGYAKDALQAVRKVKELIRVAEA